MVVCDTSSLSEVRSPTSAQASFALSLVLLPLPGRRSRFKGATMPLPTKGRAKGLVARISSLPIQSQCSTSAPSPPAHPPQFAVATPQPNCRAAELLLPFYTSVAPPSFPFYQTAPAMSDLWEKHFQCNVVPILSAMATSKLHK